MVESNRTKNSLLNLLSGFAGQMSLVLLKFVTRTVFIYTLGKEYLGINGLFSDIIAMLSITELGFDTAINFRLYKPLAERDAKTVRILLKFYKQAYRVIGFVILGLGILLIPALRYLINDYDSLEALGINAVLIFLLYLLQTVSSYLFFAYRSAIIKADQKTYITNIVNMAVTIATNIVQICILYFLHDFILYTATVILFNIIQNGVNAIIAQRMYPQFFIKEKESLSKEEFISMLKDCGALFVYRVNGVVLKATDNIVLSAFIGLTIVGLYSNYLLFYTTIKNFLGKALDSFKASMGNLYASSNIAKNYSFFEVMNFTAVILYGTACVGVAVEADEFIVNWIGTDYLIERPFSILMGIEILFVGIKTNLGQMRDISGVFRQMWLRPVFGIIINIVASIALVHVWGIYGVLTGTILADVLTNFLIDPFIIHKYTYKNYKPVSCYYKKNFSYFGILAIIEIVDFIICNTLFVNMGIFSLIIHILICGISVPAIFALVYWRSDECQYIVNKVISIINRRKK